MTAMHTMKVYNKIDFVVTETKIQCESRRIGYYINWSPLFGHQPTELMSKTTAKGGAGQNNYISYVMRFLTLHVQRFTSNPMS